MDPGSQLRYEGVDPPDKARGVYPFKGLSLSLYYKGIFVRKKGVHNIHVGEEYPFSGGRSVRKE